ncbi:MAG: flagellar hook-length control protein FliK [Methylotenera sp.]
MQNLTLQMAQTTALKKAMGVTNNNNASADNAAAPESNTSFQALLNKQAKAHKDSARQELAQQKLAQQKPAPKISNAQEGDEGEQKSRLAADYAEFVVAVNDKKNNDSSVSEHIEFVENASAAPIVQAIDTPNKTQMAAEDADDREASNSPTDAGVIATTTPILAPIVLTPATHSRMASASENSGLPAANTASQAIITAESAAPQNKSAAAARNEAQDVLSATNAKAVPEQIRWTDVMQSATKQVAIDESVTAKSMLDTAKEGNKDMAIKNIAIPASPHTLTQMSASLPVQAASTNTINVYPGKAGWDQAISQKVVWMVGAGEQSATLTLNPPELGPLQVVINVQNDKADTTFISDNAEVRQALQDGMSNLREKMSESGIQLGQANVSSGGQAQQEFQQAMQNRAASRLDKSAPISHEENAASTKTLTRVANGLVDTFA